MHPREDPGLELEWLREFTPATRAAASLPSLSGERLLPKNVQDRVARRSLNKS